MSALAPVTRHPYRYAPADESSTPLLDALNAEQEAIAAAERDAAAEVDWQAEKINAAHVEFAKAYTFTDPDGNKFTLTGTNAARQAYADYLLAVEAAEVAHAALVDLLPALKRAHRILADAGEVEYTFPEPVGLRLFHAV